MIVITMANQQQSVLGTLRQMILVGEIAPATRLAEAPTAEKLGVSRTPVRIAFRSLEQEGLLDKLPGRGYQVRSITEADVQGAIEVRGVLEGLAAMQAAEKGLSAKAKQQLLSCLEEGDKLFDKGHVTVEDIECYQAINQRFHQIILQAAGNPAIENCLSRNAHLPFASPSALAVDVKALKNEFKRFYLAHMQHHTVYDALLRGQGARAEAIMREHANATINYAKLFVSGEASIGDIQIIKADAG